MAELIPIDGLGAGIVKKADDEERRLKSGQLSLMLQHKFGSKLRFNLLTKNIEVDGERLSVDEFEGKHVALSEQGWEITPTACRDAISYAAKQNSYHPIREYLDWVATSDVEPFDLDHIASYPIGTNDPLYDAMIAATLVGAVARIYEPGCQMDTCCVLRDARHPEVHVLEKSASPACFAIRTKKTTKTGSWLSTAVGSSKSKRSNTRSSG